MRLKFPAIVAAIALSFCTLYALAKARTDLRARDGTRVVIVPVGKAPAPHDSESRIEFYSPLNQMLCALDYSSEDGEHGFGVVKAAWTPDNKFFVFSLASSGGHQAWHAPTLFFDLRNQTIQNLDAYVDGAAGISDSAFRLNKPSVVVTMVWADGSVPKEFDLEKLSKNGSSAPRSLPCTGGKIIRTESSVLSQRTK